MALTRKALKAMGLSDEQVDSIVEMHAETVDGLKDRLKAAEEQAETLESAKKELDALKAKSGDDWKSKYEKEHSDFEAFKNGVSEKELKTAKENAVKSYFESKNITGTNLDIAMRGAVSEIAAVELDDGKIKDTTALDALVSGTYAGLVVSKTVLGAQTVNPPANNGGAKLTRADIYKKDANGRYIMSTAERQKALAENKDLL